MVKNNLNKHLMGDRKYDPMLSISGNQGLSMKDTVDAMIAKAIK